MCMDRSNLSLSTRLFIQFTMLLPYSARLRRNNIRIVLASMSPRRQELMRMLLPDERTTRNAAASDDPAAATGSTGGPVPFRCVPSTFAEDLLHSDHADGASYACATSLAKAKEVWMRVQSDTDILIAADTVVLLDGEILEKPACTNKLNNGHFALTNVAYQLIMTHFTSNDG
jgi:predicted house-cleaning NTP pyrophosphatase (Maf/HAM1 superfamily)